jgi:hypothetical protein
VLVPLDAAVDQIVGPLYFRALIAGSTIDDDFVDAIVDAVVRAPAARGPQLG